MGLKNDVEINDPSLFEYTSEDTALTHDTAGLNVNYNRKKNIFSKYHIYYWKLLIDTNRLFETAWNKLLEEKSIETFC